MDRETLEGLTRDELYDLATDGDVSGRSSMTKAELVDALADVSAVPPDGGPGDETDEDTDVRRFAPLDRDPDGPRVTGLDPVLAEARDATREAEDVEPEDRPTVSIDPALVKVREQTIAADKASERDVRDAPGIP